MIDIHTHIIPNIDDGSRSIDETIKMLQMEIQDGVTDIILTPHFINTDKRRIEKSEYLKGYRTVQNIISSNDLNIKAHFGGEIFMLDSTFYDVKNGVVPTISTTKYILVELPLIDVYDFSDIINSLYNLSLYYKVILAHPERYHYLRIEDIFKLTKYSEMQLNTTSILGLDGMLSKRRAFQIIRNGLATYVASDCHESEIRCPNMSKAKLAVEKKFNKEIAEELFNINPKKIIDEINKD